MLNKNGFLLIVSTAFISGLSIFINKFGVSGIDAAVFTTLKNTLVTVFLFTILLSIKKFQELKQLSSKQWLQLIVIGLLGGSLPFLLFFKGLTMTSAPEASFIQKNMFLFVAILAPIILKEKLNKNIVLTLLFFFIGNIFLLNMSFNLHWNNGNTLILLATLLWAAENILSKHVLTNLSGTIVAWGRMFFGSLFLITYLGFTDNLIVITQLSSPQWGWIIVTSLFLLGYVYTWYNGLKTIPVTTATAILALGSPITTLLSLSITSTIITPIQIIGMVSFLIGTIIIMQYNRILQILSKVKRIPVGE